MKVLIAGATGLIGKELVRQCHQLDISVHYLTTRKNKIVQNPEYKGFYWNPKTKEIDQAAFEDVDAIVNLAGASVSKRWTAAYKEEILSSRIDTANLLFESIKHLERVPEYYISSSGISIYPSSLQKLYTEEHETYSDSFLGEVSVAWEAAADQFAALPMKVSKVRTGIVLDADEGALPKIVTPIRMGIGAPLGSGEQWQSWIHIEDIAGIYLFLLQNNKSGVFNGVAPNPVTNKRMTTSIAQHLKKPLWLPKVPVFMLKLLLGEMADLVVESQLVSAQKIEAAGYQFRYVNLEKAIEDLV